MSTICWWILGLIVYAASVALSWALLLAVDAKRMTWVPQDRVNLSILFMLALLLPMSLILPALYWCMDGRPKLIWWPPTVAECRKRFCEEFPSLGGKYFDEYVAKK